MRVEGNTARGAAPYRLFRACVLSVTAAVVGSVLPGSAQQPPAGAQPKPAEAKERPASNDPRVGLKPGFRNAGEAARNMELVASLPKPEGFFDPASPAGVPSGPERETPDEEARPGGQPAQPGQPGEGQPPTQPAGQQKPEQAGQKPVQGEQTPGQKPAEPGAQAPGQGEEERPETPEQRRRASSLNFANSDLAFSGHLLFAGNFHGFNTYDIENARKPRLLASIVCPGGQGDVSVHGNLLFMSVEQTRGRIDCGTEGVEEPVSAERFRGIRIFDITDVKKPRQIAAVQTCRGSHTHTLVVDPDDKANLYIYGSGTGAVRSAEELAGCSGLDPKEDPNTALFSIDVIQVPLSAPEKAQVVNRPRIFADPSTGALSGLWQGGTHGEGTQRSRMTNQCHDITVMPEVGLAAGACSGNGILLDISDPVNPVRLDAVTDKSFAYWHSATFNNDGTKIVFTDEWGGGTRPRCRPSDPPTWGANAIFDIVDGKLRFGSYYKLPAPQTEQENCVAHNGSIIPVPGRDIMVQGWYQGGISVFDFTDSQNPVEIAFFDRGPISEKDLITGGYWSAYWFNGHIYGAEIARGIDVFRLTPGEHLSQNEIEAATMVRTTEFNAQHQPRITWPANTVVARAYVDQLARSKTLDRERQAALRSALDRSERLRTGQERGASEIVGELETLASALERDAATATGIDGWRMRALAETIRDRTAKLKG